MARVQINLARSPFVNRVVPLATFFVLAGAALIFTVFNVVMFAYTGGGYRKLRTSVTEQEASIRDLQAAIAEKQAIIQAASDRIFTEEAKFVDDLLTEKGFSWTLFLARLEEVKSFGTMLQRINPMIDKDGRIFVGVRGQANPREEMLKLLQNLFESPYFRNPQIDSESKDLQNPWVEFQIDFEYVPDPPGLSRGEPPDLQAFGDVVEPVIEDRIGPPLPPGEVSAGGPEEAREVPAGRAGPKGGLFPW